MPDIKGAILRDTIKGLVGRDSLIGSIGRHLIIRGIVAIKNIYKYFFTEENKILVTEDDKKIIWPTK